MSEERTQYRWQARTFDTYRPPNRLNRGLVTMAPWLDAVLLLVFFLLATSRFVLQPGIAVRLPAAPFTGGASPYGLLAVVLVQETADGKGAEEIMYFDDARFVLEQPGAADKLKAAFAEAVRNKPDQAMIIEADRQVKHGTLTSLINMAASAGIPEVFMATRPNGAGEAP